MTTSEFLSKIKPVVIADMQKTGILASLTAAQAILESGWGKSELAIKANNLFGIKGKYNGQSVTIKTKEFVDGQWILVDAAFKKYPTWQEGVADHSNKFLTMDRYAKLRNCKDYKLACKYVFEAGYANGPEYTPTLIKIIEQNKLYEWDQQAAGSPVTVQNGSREEAVSMVKSPLATLTVDFGTHKSNARTQKITKITPHHMAVTTTDPVGVANAHLKGNRQASANYYIAGGKICAGVSEDRRAWTSSSSENDQKAITFEVANCGGSPDWKVSDQDYQALVNLCADICKRYGINPHYDGTRNGTITVHKMFSATGCPGPYLMSKIESLQFENDIKAAMGGNPAPTPQPERKVGKYYWKVQVGAFAKKENADAHAEKMKQIGQKPYVFLDKDHIWKVQVGAFDDKANADKLADAVRDAGFKTIVVHKD